MAPAGTSHDGRIGPCRNVPRSGIGWSLPGRTSTLNGCDCFAPRKNVSRADARTVDTASSSGSDDEMVGIDREVDESVRIGGTDDDVERGIPAVVDDHLVATASAAPRRLRNDLRRRLGERTDRDAAFFDGRPARIRGRTDPDTEGIRSGSRGGLARRREGDLRLALLTGEERQRRRLGAGPGRERPDDGQLESVDDGPAVPNADGQDRLRARLHGEVGRRERCNGGHGAESTARLHSLRLAT